MVPYHIPGTNECNFHYWLNLRFLVERYHVLNIFSSTHNVSLAQHPDSASNETDETISFIFSSQIISGWHKYLFIP